jgi:hypothetical protein
LYPLSLLGARPKSQFSHSQGGVGDAGTAHIDSLEAELGHYQSRQGIEGAGQQQRTTVCDTLSQRR